MSRKAHFRTMIGAGALLLGQALVFGSAGAAQPTVIELTQTGCQFVESENGVDHRFRPMTAADCTAVNAKTGADRVSAAKVLELKAGTYVFRVKNENVPYELGFWLREHDYNNLNPIHKLTKISVSGGGLHRGDSGEYMVELEPGEYLYSCPLNPTPDYRLVVKG